MFWSNIIKYLLVCTRYLCLGIYNHHVSEKCKLCFNGYLPAKATFSGISADKTFVQKVFKYVMATSSLEITKFSYSTNMLIQFDQEVIICKSRYLQISVSVGLFVIWFKNWDITAYISFRGNIIWYLIICFSSTYKFVKSKTIKCKFHILLLI